MTLDLREYSDGGHNRKGNPLYRKYYNMGYKQAREDMEEEKQIAEKIPKTKNGNR